MNSTGLAGNRFGYHARRSRFKDPPSVQVCCRLEYVDAHEFSDHMILSSELRDHMIVQACSAAFEGGAQAVAAWLDEGGSVDARCAEQDERPLSCAEIGDVTLLIAAAFGRAASPACTARRARCPRCHTMARAP